RKLCLRGTIPAFSRRRRNCSRGRAIKVGALRRRSGRHSPSAGGRWPVFALSRCCSSQFHFSRLKPTHAEALAGTVGVLAVTAAALPDAAEASGAVAPSAWHVSVGRALVLAPSASRVSAARELAAAPSA